MSAIYILIGCSIPLALGFLVVFLLSARRGQFDDDYTPSIRILMDDTLTTDNTKPDKTEKV
ncbi:MAG: cbb3-type cytochrome oxidase assembly protein CcoS [Flavobacteriales bacterium]|jgi:cbb3-type cytochrome oxidase maturation protein